MTVRLSSRGIYNCSFLVTWVEMDISKGVYFSKEYMDHASSLGLKSNNSFFVYFANIVKTFLSQSKRKVKVLDVCVPVAGVGGVKWCWRRWWWRCLSVESLA